MFIPSIDLDSNAIYRDLFFFFVFAELRLEVRGNCFFFVDIGGIVYQDCLNFLFIDNLIIKTNTNYRRIKNQSFHSIGVFNIHSA